MSAPSTSSKAAGSATSPAGRSRRLTRERARTAALVILAVLITLFAVLNVKDVEVDWIFGSGHAPLIVVIVLSLLVGAVIARAAGRAGRRS